jgi:acetyltransferase-like isoleucine patch superfamily enzyme
VREIRPDPAFELGLSEFLRAQHDPKALVALYARFAAGDAPFESLMRRAIWRAVARSFGHGVEVGDGVGFKHLETFDIGSNVFIGAQSYLQGRYDGHFVVGDRVWIGPQCYFDARDLEIGEEAGIGPGVKILGSTHVGTPIEVPIVRTDLRIEPVRIEPWADVGMNSVILPGVTIGKGSIVGAGAVVTRDVPPMTIVAGVPAKVVRRRDEAAPGGGVETR